MRRSLHLCTRSSVIAAMKGDEMMVYRLVPHAVTPSEAVSAVDVKLLANEERLDLRFMVRDAEGLVLPAAQPSTRTDGLWRTTCFEIFLRARGCEGYLEFNFSPSGQWAAYAFDAYRAGMRNLTLAAEPRVKAGRSEELFFLDASVDLSPASTTGREMSLSAVIEEVDGTKSYWALAHPAGKPDFHDPACFVAELPAPNAE